MRTVSQSPEPPRQVNVTLTEAMHLAEKRPLWRLLAACGTMLVVQTGNDDDVIVIFLLQVNNLCGIYKLHVHFMCSLIEIT